MVFTAHLLAGAVLAAKIKFVPLALFLAFLSHYVLDLLPHTQYSIRNIQKQRWRKSLRDFLKLSLDFCFGILLISLFSKNLFLALAGGALAAFPDVLIAAYYFPPKIKLLDCHFRLHHWVNDFFECKKTPLFWRIFSQLAMVILAILVLCN